MLVLSRKKGEVIRFTDVAGNQVLVTVSAISGNRVAIGIDAPREIKVIRGELVADQQWPLPGTNVEAKTDAAL